MPKEKVKQGNQYKADPRQAKFLAYYLDIDSDTFSNAFQSAIKAGYSPKYADDITTKGNQWMEDIGGDLEMLLKAEENLVKALNIDIENKEIGDRGLKATMFVAERLGKKKYGKNIDVTSKGGRIIISPDRQKDIDDALSNM